MKNIVISVAGLARLLGVFGAGLLISGLNRDSSRSLFVFLDRVVAKIEREWAEFSAPEIAGPPKEYFPTTFIGLEGGS